MSYDTSTVSFSFRFAGENAEEQANECFNQLPTGQSFNELSKRINQNNEPIFFVSTEMNLDATSEYVRDALVVMEQFEPDNFA